MGRPSNNEKENGNTPQGVQLTSEEKKECQKIADKCMSLYGNDAILLFPLHHLWKE
jgi:hypothetical protein